MPTISIVSLSTVRLDLASSTSRQAPWSAPATPTCGPSTGTAAPASARAPTCCISLIASSRSGGGAPGAGNAFGTGSPRSSAPSLDIIWSSDTRTSATVIAVARPPRVPEPPVVGEPLSVDRPSPSRATSSSQGRRLRVVPKPELKSPVGGSTGGERVTGLTAGLIVGLAAGLIVARPIACRAASSRLTSATSTLCLRK